VQTYLQSGNVLFERDAVTDSFKEQVAASLSAALGKTMTILFREHADLTTVIAQNPFVDEALALPARVAVVFLSRPPDDSEVAALRDAHVGPEQFVCQGSHLYMYYPAGQADTKLVPALIERRLKALSTGRNWNTVSKLHELSA
jgi:uncharacterized protein (DUF1697 family)